MNVKKLFLAIAVVGLLAAVLVYVLVINKPHTDVAKTEAAFDGSAEVFYGEFQTNKEAAGLRYIGKVVQVSGVITEVGSSAEQVTLQLEAGNPMGGGLAVALAPSESGAARQLQSGQSVVVRGECSGVDEDEGGLLGALGATVQLTSCLIIY